MSENYEGIPNSSMSIVSLVAGILGLTVFPVIGSIVAVITGPMAKREIAESGGTLGGERLAQVGTILGWVGIGFGVLGICIGILAIVLVFGLAGFGIASEEWGSLLPFFLSVL